MPTALPDNVPVTRAEFEAFLGAIGVAFRSHEHPAVFRVEEGLDIKAEMPGAHTKNLFLKDKKGAMWLVVAAEDRLIDMKALRPILGSAALSFASADTLRRVLGVEPGAVTPFALVNDDEHRVRVVLDAGLMAHGTLNFHPLVNTATTTIAAGDLLRFIRACGHEPQVQVL